MTLDLAYSYCSGLSKDEEIRIDIQVSIMATNKMIPLIYINGHYSYKLFKKLRAGDLITSGKYRPLTFDDFLKTMHLGQF